MLDPRHVLTAQHCLYDDQGRLHSPERCFIIAGAHRRPGAGRRCGLAQARSEADKVRLRAELEGVLEWVKLANIDNKVWTEEVEPSGVLTREMMVDRWETLSTDEHS